MKKEQGRPENSQELGRKEQFLKYCFFNQGKIVGWIATALGLTILAIVFATNSAGPEMTHKARVAFEKWKKTPNDAHLTQEMKLALEKAPSLHRAIEGEIVQTLLSNGVTPIN